MISQVFGKLTRNVWFLWRCGRRYNMLTLWFYGKYLLPKLLVNTVSAKLILWFLSVWEDEFQFTKVHFVESCVAINISGLSPCSHYANESVYRIISTGTVNLHFKLALIFSHDYHAGAETLMTRHFQNPNTNFASKSKWNGNGGKQHPGNHGNTVYCALPNLTVTCWSMQVYCKKA